MMVMALAASSQVFTFSAVIGVYNVANPLLLMVITISMVMSPLHMISIVLSILCRFSVDFS